MKRTESTVEINSVETVLRELGPLINEVQRGLEIASEGAGEERRDTLGQTIGRLDDICGTLKLLDIHGAGMLCREMRLLAASLRDGNVDDAMVAFEALLKATLRLRDYLDRVRAGQQDMPVALLDLLNELRQLRAAEALDEREVFFPDLSRVPRRAAGPGSDDFVGEARRMRPRFRRALLGWYRDEDVEACLRELATVLRRLADASASAFGRRVWAVSGALIEALSEHGLEADNDVRRLMGRVERLISRVAREGEDHVDRQVPIDLLRGLLYHVARAGSTGAEVRAVREEFGLPDQLGSPAAESRFQGPDSALLEVVADGIREDIAAVKDAVEIYVHSPQRRGDALNDVPAQLARIADTFSMLGRNDDHDTLQAESEVVAAIGDYEQEAALQRLQALADVLLRLEGDLGRLLALDESRGGAAHDSESRLAGLRLLPASEYRALLSATVGAALEDLAKVREALAMYCGSDEVGTEAVAEVPALLDEVEGALAMLPLPEADEVVRVLTAYVREDIVSRGLRPGDDEQVLIADVVAGVEYYLEAVDHDRAEMVHLLQGAERAIHALRGQPEAAGHADDESVIMQSTPDDTVEAAAFDTLEWGPVQETGDADPTGPAAADGEDTEDAENAEDTLDATLGSDLDFDDYALTEFDETAPADAGPDADAEVSDFLARELAGDTAPADSGEGEEAQAGDSVETTASVDATAGDEGIDFLLDADGAVESGSAETGEPDGDSLERPPGEDTRDPQDSREADESAAEAAADRPSRTSPAEGQDRGDTAFELPPMDPDAAGGDAGDGPVEAPSPASGDAAQARTQDADAGLEPRGDEATGEAGADDSTADFDLPPMDPDAGEAGEEEAPGDAGATAMAEEPAVGTGAAPEGHGAETARGGAGQDSGLVILGDDVDDEIVEVYIEEALGELDRINEYLPRWRANPADEEALIVVRRAFHTLKGGGRLIGAELIGEFSWAMENMLNRVIDQSIDTSTALFDTLDDGVSALPQLIEQIRGNRAPIDGIDELIERAHALSRGESDPPPGGGPARSTDPRPDRGSGQAGADSPSAPPSADSPASSADAEAPAAAAVTSAFAPVEAGADDDAPGGYGEGDDSIDADAAATPGGDAAVEPASSDRARHGSGDGLDAPAGHSAQAAAPRGAADPDPDPDPRAAADPPSAATEARDDSDDDADMALLDIFADEAARHLAVIRDLLPADPEAAAPMSPDADMLRALHTLHGSAQTAEVEPIVAIAGPMERILRQHRDHSGQLSADELAAFREGLHAMESIAGQLPELAASADTADVAQRLDGLWQGLASDDPEPGESEGNELLDIFIDEGDELVEACERAVQVWRDDPDAVDRVMSDLQRNLHTLKGGARMANFPPIADLTHEIESLVDAVADDRVRVDTSVFELLQEAIDALTVLLEQARSRQGVSSVDWLIDELRNRRLRETEGDRADGGSAPPAAAQSDVAAEAGEEREASGGGAEAAPTPRTEAAPGSDQIRVQADLLDNLVNFAGEVSIYHSRLGEHLGQYKFNLTEFEQTVSRLREQLRSMENETESQILYRHEKEAEQGLQHEDFDPLEFDRYTRIQELSRSLAESVGDLDSIKDILDNLTRDAETLLLQQSRVSSELQGGLMQTRMVRFDGLRARFARVVRQTANAVGKQAELRMSGGEIEVDRSIQERIVGPLEHVLRNAVSHGIEGPEARRRQGKPETGIIRFDLHRGGTDIVMDITDDGAGIDPARIRRKAVEKGLIDDADAYSDEEIVRFILETGFTTADEVTQVSGRGVGMDVVDAEIRLLGGTLGIRTESGVGTRFSIRLPVTLAINQAVLVDAGEDTYAIPIASIEGVSQVPAGDLRNHYVDPSQPVHYGGNEYALHHLGRLLGTAEPRLEHADVSYPVVMIRAGDERVALHVDRLVGRREVVVKPLGAPLNTLPGISGATIMADGTVVLILDVGGLLRTEGRVIETGGLTEAAAAEARAPASVEEAAGERPAGRSPTVLVVDDSITIRKVTERVLTRNGVNVATAKDGVDAVSWMGHSIPDLILLDIEMPRMDGYEVAQYVRNDTRLAEVPIIMVTSRTGEKHRERAEAIGVDHYLGKPYQEGELMDTIRELVPDAETA